VRKTQKQPNFLKEVYMKKVLCIMLAMLLVSSFAFAQANIGLKAVGGQIGFIMPEDPIDNTIGFGATADLGTITPKIHLKAFFDYWGKSYDQGTDFEYTFSEFIIGATAKYYFADKGEMKPYAGAGLDFIIGKSSWEYTGQYSQYYAGDGSESDSEIGFHFCAGADYPLSKTLTGFGEVKYTMDGADFFGIYVGAVYKLK
jgi:opacity protein-like surface antigen